MSFDNFILRNESCILYALSVRKTARHNMEVEKKGGFSRGFRGSRQGLRKRDCLTGPGANNLNNNLESYFDLASANFVFC